MAQRTDSLISGPKSRSAATSFRPTETDSREASHLLDLYFAERSETFVGGQYRPTIPEPAAFTVPHGIFALMDLPDAPAIGCGGIKSLGDGRFEIKHIYIHPDFRGKGLSKPLMNWLEVQAASLGASALFLDTNDSLTSAVALYRSVGYREIASYNDNPNANLWMAKRLSA